MPRFVHEPWCDPRSHAFDWRNVEDMPDMICTSEGRKIPGYGAARLEQGLDDTRPSIRLALGREPWEVELTPEAAVVLAACVRDRSGELVSVLEELAGTAQSAEATRDAGRVAGLGL